MKKGKLHVLFCSIIIVFCLAVSFCELSQDSIFPYDSALFASTGAFFNSILCDPVNFISAPLQWMYDYYNQYPALSVRRHPPLFSITEGFVFLFTGISVFGAKLTYFIFVIFFALAVYFACFQIWKNEWYAVIATSIMLINPVILRSMLTIFLDIPSMAFAFWALYFYGKMLENKSYSSMSMMMLCILATFYTYQLPIFIISGLGLHFVYFQRHLLKDKNIIIILAIFLLLMLPLIIFTLLTGQDNLRVASGMTVEKWKAFAPLQGESNIQHWLYYVKIIILKSPIQLLILAIWLLTLPFCRISSAEILLLLCFTLSYAGFSWITSKGVRYSFYMVAPLSMFIVPVIKNILQLTSKKKTIAIVVAIFLGGIVQAYFLLSYPIVVKNMEKPIKEILAQKEKRIFYCGPLDGAFIFYLRKMDTHRKARVYRATVQAKKADEVFEFVKKNDINIIVYEENDTTVIPKRIATRYELYKKNIEKIPYSKFKLLKKFRIDYGKQELWLNVYVRQN